MNDWLNRLLAAWVVNGKITETVVTLARLVGLSFDDLTLAAAVRQSQRWMNEVRPPGTPRWQMPATMTTDMDKLKEVLLELGLTKPYPPALVRTGAVVILGATYRVMRDRLAYADTCNMRAEELLVVASRRRLTGPKQNAVEVADLRTCGFDPEERTEADAARFLLENVSQDISSVTRVIDTPDQADGKPAATEQTIHAVADALTRGTEVYFVLHQPYARQVLTVLRALRVRDNAAGLRPEFVIGSMSKPINELLSVIVDEAWRMLYEIELYQRGA